MNKDQLKSNLEALLFSYGEPLSLGKLAELTLGQNQLSQVQETLAELGREFRQDSSRGLLLVKNNGAYQLTAKPENFPLVEKLVKQDFQEELSPASLEVLTIVLYRGPLSRAEIDYIRGVNSSFILRGLLLRGLVERQPDTKGHHLFLYSPSFESLRFLGIASVEELPDFAVLSKKYEEILTASSEKETLNPEVEKLTRQSGSASDNNFSPKQHG